MCSSKLFLTVKFFSQRSHLLSFFIFFVASLKRQLVFSTWTFNESLTGKPLPHLSQMKFLFLSWRRFLCFFNSTGRPKDLSQMLHLKSFLPSWTVCTWKIKLERIVNVFKHNRHWINFGSPEPLGLPFFGLVENWICSVAIVVRVLGLYNR